MKVVVALFASTRVMSPLSTTHLSKTLSAGASFAVRVTVVPSAALLISVPAPIVALPSVTVMSYSVADAAVATKVASNTKRFVLLKKIVVALPLSVTADIGFAKTYPGLGSTVNRQR